MSAPNGISPSSALPLGLVHGFVAPGFEPVAEELERNLTERGDRGAAFAAYVDGRPVIDVWGGLADAEHEVPWRRDTIAGVFSGSKGLVAACLLLLIDRGALDLEAPVCAYWPEFAAHAKDGVLVRHLVSHQAGLPGLATPVTPVEAADDVRMAALLAAQPALRPPGTWLCYHAVTFGWLCGELIRRVDGRSVGHFFAEEVAGPLDLDAWIGLPAEQEPRVAMFERGAGFDVLTGASREDDPIAWSIWDNPPRFSSDPLPANTRHWRAAEIPATNGVASARAMARLYGCLARGGELDGVRLLAPRTLELGTTCLGRGVGPFHGEPMAFSVGFGLQTEAMEYGPARVAFGHNGAGGSVHGAWPRSRVGFSYVPNVLCVTEGADPRSAALLRALDDAVRRTTEAR
jgi:CubicO group peptidase (beta-lactamase class C family)